MRFVLGRLIVVGYEKKLTEEQIADRADPIPIPRISTPDDIADVIFDLAIGTQMTTGQLRIVDSGRTV
ncbi:MAG: hypothetical protein P8M80_10860 [Pirellulaceae bacterium]|nr:hypothetical protein [Pirellulaceae bacterium]